MLQLMSTHSVQPPHLHNDTPLTAQNDDHVCSLSVSSVPELNLFFPLVVFLLLTLLFCVENTINMLKKAFNKC